MEKEFIPYEQALALKELGFDEPCLTWWNKKEFVYPYWEREFGYNYKSGIAKDCVLSPLYQQAFRWFRENYRYDVAIKKRKFEIEKLEIYGESDPDYYFTDFPFDSYEESELKCLKKLIEIVKNK